MVIVQVIEGFYKETKLLHSQMRCQVNWHV